MISSRWPAELSKPGSSPLGAFATASLALRLEGNRADHGGTMHQAALRQSVVADREMHRGGVVPHQEISDLPFVAIKKLRPHTMSIELRDQIHRLGVRHALDADALAGGDVERFAAGIRMGADDRMGNVGGC